MHAHTTGGPESRDPHTYIHTYMHTPQVALRVVTHGQPVHAARRHGEGQARGQLAPQGLRQGARLRGCSLAPLPPFPALHSPPHTSTRAEAMGVDPSPIESAPRAESGTSLPALAALPSRTERAEEPFAAGLVLPASGGEASTIHTQPLPCPTALPTRAIIALSLLGGAA